MNWLERRISLHSNDSPQEERANALTHFVGVIMSVVGTGLLIAKPADPGMRIAYIVFGFSMIALFGASTSYHSSPPGSQRKRLFRLADHLSIFILIAGTYTPIMSALDTEWAFWTLAAVWALAVTGIVLKIFLWDRFKRWQLVFFLGMGWLAIVRIGEIVQVLPTEFLYLLLAGGLFYSVGTIAYSLKHLRYHHAVWHLFVLAGAGSFFWGVYRYI